MQSATATIHLEVDSKVTSDQFANMIKRSAVFNFECFGVVFLPQPRIQGLM